MRERPQNAHLGDNHLRSVPNPEGPIYNLFYSLTPDLSNLNRDRNKLKNRDEKIAMEEESTKHRKTDANHANPTMSTNKKKA